MKDEVKIPTIYEIAERVKKTNPKFFSANTLEAFGQTMEDFVVEVSPSGRIFIYAELWRDRGPGEIGAGKFTSKGRKVLAGHTFQELVGDTFETPHEGVEGSTWRPIDTTRKYNIIRFISES